MTLLGKAPTAHSGLSAWELQYLLFDIPELPTFYFTILLVLLLLSSTLPYIPT
jgi:hypothetical protein